MAGSLFSHGTASIPSIAAVERDTCSLAAEWLLRGPLTIALWVLGVVQLATWIPHYLTWPMWSDHDVYATLAQAWDEGRLPYREMRCNNFPGSIYLFWILGKLFGWGRALPIYAVDAALVLAFGAMLAIWSRKQLASLLPGAIGFLAFLSFYLGVDYTLAAQHDFHGPVIAILSMLLVEITHSRWSRWLLPLLFALAVALRPQTVLLIPAACLAIDESVRRPGEPLYRTLRACLGCGAGFVLLAALLFAPLVLAGVFGDFVRSIQLVTYGGHYNRVTVLSFLVQWFSQFGRLPLLAVPLAIPLLSRWGDPALRRAALTWLAALAGVSFYRPLSPFAHAYLVIPLMLTWSVSVALLMGLMLAVPWTSSRVQLAVVLLGLCLGITPRPPFCLLGPSAHAVSTHFAEQRASDVPPGYRRGDIPSSAFYPWSDYCAMLAYLQHETTPETKVANALKGVPAVTGPVARQSAFPAESLAWLWMVNRHDESAFASALANAKDSVVVWIPAEVGPDPSFTIAEIERVIKTEFESAARFGAIEVWRRKQSH